MIDLYPSRISDKPTITERKDPVIYTDSSKLGKGPLEADQLDFYEKNGFLFLERFFSEEDVQLMRDELKQTWEESRESDAPEVIHEPESQDVRSVFAVHRDNDFFKDVSRNPRIVDIMNQLLGSEVYIHQSRINLKTGFKGKEFYWHSDFETWHVEDGMPRMRAISCSIALTDNNPHNGPLMVVPGSHKHYITCVGKTPESHYQKSLRRQEYGVPDPDSLTWLANQGGIAMPTGAAGSILLFDCNTMHGSNSNISPFSRSNIFMVYNSVENALVEPFSGQKPRPEFIASREMESIFVK
jgi:ectoine hydroxylase